MPPEASGIADYSALLLPALRGHVDVTVAKRGAKRPPRGIDLAVYHIGNNPDAHGWILDALRRVPGVVVLHDFVLHHLVAGVTIGRRDGHGYLDAMEREHGVVGRLLGARRPRQAAAAALGGAPRGLPARGRRALARDRSRRPLPLRRGTGRARPDSPGPIEPVPHPGVARSRASQPAAIDGDPLIGAFGNVNRVEARPAAPRGFARLRAEHPGARLLLVGATSPGFDLERRLQRLGLGGDGIVREGYVDERRLWELMAACDVHVNLRSPTMGETSGTAIRALTLGKPLVVSDVGWFAELPDGVALRSPSATTRSTTSRRRSGSSPSAPTSARAMGDAARALARASTTSSGSPSARRRRSSGSPAATPSPTPSLREVSEAAAGVGIAPGTPEAEEIARRLAEVDLGG